MLSSHDMIYFATTRASLAGARRAEVYIAAWGILAHDRERALDELLQRRLRSKRSVLVVSSDDEYSRRLERALPGTMALVGRHARLIEQIGHYRVMRFRATSRPNPPRGRGVLPRHRTRG